MQSNDFSSSKSKASVPMRLLAVLALMGLCGLVDLASGHLAAGLAIFFSLCAFAVYTWRQAYQRSHALVTVTAECAHCQRIKLSDEGWVTNGGYIQDQVRSERPAQKACPDCARLVYALAGYRDQPPSSS
jgi:hypothetical protein